MRDVRLHLHVCEDPGVPMAGKDWHSAQSRRCCCGCRRPGAGPARFLAAPFGIQLAVAPSRNGITPPRTGPLFCLHFVALLKFSMYKIIWPVMALACGSLHMVVTFVPNG
jgi:hypothetical protein